MTNIKLVIFDLDGTLYSQKKLRKRYLLKMLFSMATFRLSIKQFLILKNFRIWREENKGLAADNLGTFQFEALSEEHKYPVSLIDATIKRWMYTEPLPFLKNCLYPYCSDFFQLLKAAGIKTAIYSDFPVNEKLEALGLESDYNLCSTDDTLNQFKPNEKGLKKICQYFKVKPEESAYFGDREDTDGVSAELANIKFIKVDPAEASSRAFYKKQIENFS